MLMTEISIRSFTGSHIKPYLTSIARLSSEVLKEYPFLCDTEEHFEREFLQKFAESDEAIVVLVFDGSTIVGVSTGIPLMEEAELYAKPLKQRHFDIGKIFFFGNSLLLKPYRNRGIGHHFFDIREEYVKKLEKYTALSFCSVDPVDLGEAPSDYWPLDDFWRKRGFIHYKDIQSYIKWKDVHTNRETSRQLSYWMKEVH